MKAVRRTVKQSYSSGSLDRAEVRRVLLELSAAAGQAGAKPRPAGRQAPRAEHPAGAPPHP